ncbi:Cytochrome P450 144 [Halioglobus japonicus]|nr:Cytochrome P450 144 [Halioglobus japonicus]
MNSAAGQTLIKSRLLDPQVIENPYPFYRELLNHAPVYRVPDTEVYLVSSWKLIHEVLKNQADYSANLTGILMTDEHGQPALFDLSQFGGTVDAIANADEPFHAVHRKLVLPQLNARKVAAMDGEVRAWARAGVQQLVAAERGDCVGELANAIPVKVMARLAGLPVEDVDQLLKWAFSGGDILAGTPDLERLVALGVSTGQMREYLASHFDAALQSVNLQDRRSVMDELAVGVREGAISEQDAVAILIVLVGAAGESTSSLVGSAIRILAENSELQQQLRRQPALIERYIEEVVRLESPFKGHYRAVLNETKLGGITIPDTARVFLLWAAANRDPQVFTDPDRLDIARDNTGEHLGFGHGIHFCIGARLARMEARVILEELLQSTSDFHLDSKFTVAHVPSIFVRRLGALHLTLSANE